MRSSDLSRRLARVSDFNTPRLKLEQYSTPPDTAAAMLLEAHRRGHIEDCRVADLGCGPGRLLVGAALLGARSVEGVDMDDGALEQARRAAADAEVIDVCSFTRVEVSHWEQQVDTVVMNPPFGSQRRMADRPFVEKALQAARHIHSLHLDIGQDYWKRTLKPRGLEVETVQRFIIKLPYTYPHHTRSSTTIEMVHLYIETKR